MLKINQKRESGQSLVLIAIMFLGLVAMAALVVDGGSTYLNRRNAQTAADAAALAGANDLCVRKIDPNPIISQYVTQNGAVLETTNLPAPYDTHGNPYIDYANDQVHVLVRLETDSFFGGAVGRETNTARAEAVAGCFAPSTTKNLLPVSWACQPPAGINDASVEECVIQSIPYDLFKTKIYPKYKTGLGEGGTLILDQGDETTEGSYVDGLPATNGKMAYIVMDKSGPTLDQCLPPIGSGSVMCDFNGDGIPELSGGGDRGWLALDGNGAKDLVDLILTGYSSPITLPQWFPVKPGADNTVFLKGKGVLEGKVVFIPVYNAYCLSTTSGTLATDCPNTTTVPGYLSGDLIATGSGASTFYRIAGFAPYVVTCISSKPNEKCPVKDMVGLKANIATFEGYFVSGVAAGEDIDPMGFDLGIYIISLIQ